MAYSKPTYWTHGDIPTAVNLNKYSADLNQIHTEIGDVARNPASPKTTSGSYYTFVHRYRWLYFESTGKIESIDGSQSVSISEQNDTVTLYDLDSVNWLYYGSLYKVTGVSFAVESLEP